jgi:hypothetical protein
MGAYFYGDIMRVYATKRGFIHGELKRIGEQFECSAEEFTEVWMSEDIKDITPPKEQKKNLSAMDVEYEPLEIPSLMEKEAKKKDEKKETKKKKTTTKAK